MDKNFYQTYFAVEKNHWLFRARRQLIYDLLDCQGIKPGEGKVLDVGCGSGFLVGQLQKKGYKAYGSDVSDEAIEFGRKRGTNDLSVMSGDKLDFSSSSFDTVLAVDILEHLENEVRLLREIERVLKPDGWAIIIVPAYKFLWGVQDEISHHYRRYTLGSLLETVKRFSSLSSVRMTYFNTFLFPPIAAVRIFSRLFRLKRRESDFDLNNGLMNCLFYGLFRAEIFMLKYVSFPFGVSILLVLKKNENRHF